MNKELLKQRISVVRFDAFNYNRRETLNIPDEKLIEIAEADTLSCTVHDTLPEFQADYNDGELDWSDCYMKFCVRPFQAMTAAELRDTFAKVKQEYQKGEICMSELLAALPADCMSIEQAAILYINAMGWANGDKYFVKRKDEVIKHIDQSLDTE